MATVGIDFNVEFEGSQSKCTPVSGSRSIQGEHDRSFHIDTIYPGLNFSEFVVDNEQAQSIELAIESHLRNKTDTETTAEYTIEVQKKQD